MKKVIKISQKCALLATWIYIIAMTVIMPFYFEEGYLYIGTNKSMFFHKVGLPLVSIALLIAAVYGVLGYAKKYKNDGTISFSITDKFMLLYTGVLLVSYWISNYPETAKMGASGWYMGFLPHMALIASYFIISRVFNREKVYLYILLAVSSIVFLLGVLNRYGIYPIEMEGSNPSFISTIGNINWYCGYWSLITWVGILIFWNYEKTQKKIVVWIVTIAVSIEFATGISQGSDSGILALVVGLFCLFLLSLGDREKLERFAALMLIFSAVCIIAHIINLLFSEKCTFVSTPYRILTDNAVPWVLAVVALIFYIFVKVINKENKYPLDVFLKIKSCLIIGVLALALIVIACIVLNTVRPGILGPLSKYSIFTFDSLWGSSRGGTWMAGLEVWKSQNIWHKLFGVGPDCMGEYIYKGGNSKLLEMVQTQFATSSLGNAHGEWITNLANLGIVGAASFAGIIFSAIYRFLKQGKKEPMLYIFAFCLLGYTVNNIFSFQTTVNTTQMFILLGVGECVWKRSTYDSKIYAK